MEEWRNGRDQPTETEPEHVWPGKPESDGSDDNDNIVEDIVRSKCPSMLNI